MTVSYLWKNLRESVKKKRIFYSQADPKGFENIDIDFDKEILENIDIEIDIVKAILKNIDIDIDRMSLRNIDIDIDKGIIRISIW